MRYYSIMNQKKTIIYINFAPYENTGNIRDYILETYDISIIFLFNFHRLTKLDQSSKLTVYRHNRPIYHTRLFQTPTIPSIAFISLPVRSLIIFAQIIFHTLRLHRKGYTFDDFFTVNAFIAWTGIILKKLNLVKKTIFWVWDYYPPIHESNMVMFMRWMYWQFDKPATYESDKTIYLNQRMVDIRKKLRVLKQNVRPIIVPVGTNPIKQTLKHDPFSFIFLGVLKKIQGLDIFFDAAKELALYNPHIILHVIGGGPDLDYYKKRAQSCPLPVIFHGYIPNESHVNAIIQKCHIGIAPYIPDESNCMYYSDPSKIKRYINFGLPVITTDVFDFSKNISRKKAGIVIPYDPIYFTNAVKKICTQYSFYQKNSLRLAQNYTYTRLYEKIFKE